MLFTYWCRRALDSRDVKSKNEKSPRLHISRHPSHSTYVSGTICGHSDTNFNVFFWERDIAEQLVCEMWMFFVFLLCHFGFSIHFIFVPQLYPKAYTLSYLQHGSCNIELLGPQLSYTNVNPKLKQYSVILWTVCQKQSHFFHFNHPISEKDTCHKVGKPSISTASFPTNSTTS